VSGDGGNQTEPFHVLQDTQPWNDLWTSKFNSTRQL